MSDIEDHIRKALEDDKFDDLPGKGKPLNLDDNPYADPDWQLAHHMLKSGGFTLPWIAARQEIEAQVETARATLAQAWEWRKRATQSSQPFAEVEAEWQRRSDRWRKRDCVMRYFQFRDLVKWMKIEIPDYGAIITFYIPMPESWTTKKRNMYRGCPHRQKPDLDNLPKALLDSVFDDDCRVWQYQAQKIWADDGAIEITDNQDM